MALFKTAEEKAAIQAQKEQALLDKFGLGNLSDPEDIKSLQKIAGELAGTGMSEFGATLSGNEKEFARLTATYTRTIVEQNFIMIRQLDRISKLLSR